MKLAPICDAFSRFGLTHDYIDTGQHYDPAMSIDIIRDLRLPSPLKNLSVGSHSHAKQTALIMEKLDNEIDAINPDIVIVYGDTNSTIAATLVAVKRNIKVAHIEAGLRSYNRGMPEEINRVATDHLSDFLYCPTETALKNLELEGLQDRSLNVGDVMTDLIYRDLEEIKSLALPRNLLGRDFLVATIHRAENTDSKQQLEKIINAFGDLKSQIILFAHPRLVNKLNIYRLQLPGNVRIMSPVPHNHLLSFALASSGVITDSGGLQKEAYILKVPCTTIRKETEWPETLFNDWNILVQDLSQLEHLVNTNKNKSYTDAFGDGQAALRIVGNLVNRI